MSSATIYAVSLLILALGAFALAGLILFRRGWFVPWLKGMVGFSLVAICIGMFLTASQLFKFNATDDNTVMATLVFAEKEDRVFSVELTNSAGERQQYRLQGEQWQLDVELMQGILGRSSSYKLHQLAGRYLSLEEEKNRLDEAAHLIAEQSVFRHSAVESLGLDSLASQILTAEFMPMIDGAIYQVYVEKGNLQARAVNEQAKMAMEAGW